MIIFIIIGSIDSSHIRRYVYISTSITVFIYNIKCIYFLGLILQLEFRRLSLEHSADLTELLKVPLCMHLLFSSPLS